MTPELETRTVRSHRPRQYTRAPSHAPTSGRHLVHKASARACDSKPCVANGPRCAVQFLRRLTAGGKQGAMAAVDRAEYMDSIKVAEIEETIQKERACVPICRPPRVRAARHALDRRTVAPRTEISLRRVAAVAPAHRTAMRAMPLHPPRPSRLVVAIWRTPQPGKQGFRVQPMYRLIQIRIALLIPAVESQKSRISCEIGWFATRKACVVWQSGTERSHATLLRPSTLSIPPIAPPALSARARPQ